MLGELGSIASGEVISRSIDWVATGIRDRSKKKQIEGLIQEYSHRAALIPSTVNLAERFSDSTLLQELLANHADLSVSKDVAIQRFLGDDSDENAVQFLTNFYDGLTKTASSDEGALAARKAAESSQRVEAEMENIKESLSHIEAKVGDGSQDLASQHALLDRLMEDVRAGEKGYEYLHHLEETLGQSFSGAYIRAYLALCTDKPIDVSTIGPIRGADGLVATLFSVAISSMRTDDAITIADFFSFDSQALKDALPLLAQKNIGRKQPIEIRAIREDVLTGIVGLLNFEHGCLIHACNAIARYRGDHSLVWNPLAIVKLKANELIQASLYDDPHLVDRATKYAQQYRDWFPEVLLKEYREALSVALTRLDRLSARNVLQNVPQALDEFIQDEMREIELNTCEDPEELLAMMTWGEARKNASLLMVASLRLIAIDEKYRQRAINIYENNLSWALPTAFSLRQYVMQINRDLGYEDYIGWREKWNDVATFHLAAYERFFEDHPTEGADHIEIAIELMRPPQGVPDLLMAPVWVPYLLNKGRVDQLLDLVSETLPLVPADQLRIFFAAVLGHPDGEAVIERVIDSVVGKDFTDPAAAVMLAQYLTQVDEVELAGRIAVKVFKQTPSEDLAEIAVHWMLDSSITVDSALKQYAVQTDSARMNLLLAHIDHAEGFLQGANAHLIRSAFGDDEEVGKRALCLYAIWNHRADERNAIVDEIVADTCVVTNTATDSKTLMFPSDSSSVRDEGLASQAGIIYSTNSEAFLRFQGHRVGDIVPFRGEQYTVTKIEDAETHLIHMGFGELAQSSGITVLQGEADEIVEQLSDQMRGQLVGESLYRDGIPTEYGRVFLGIETGGRLARGRQLEFTIGMVTNKKNPYRRIEASHSGLIDPEAKFLLSYNVVIVLSLLDLPEEVLNKLHTRCTLTTSTSERLRRDALAFSREMHSALGSMYLTESGLALVEYDESMRKDAAAKGATILEFINNLSATPPDTNLNDTKLSRVLSDNTVIDIRTAQSLGFTYVTEDILEAQVIDSLGVITRCSLSALFLLLRCMEYYLSYVLPKLDEWGAEPPIESDVIRAIKYGIATALAIEQPSEWDAHDGC